jgi:hypothetical protein
MPWKVEQGHGCSGATPWAVVKSDTGEKVACHASKEGAQRQVAALYANEPGMHSAAMVHKFDNGRCVTCGY